MLGGFVWLKLYPTEYDKIRYNQGHSYDIRCEMMKFTHMITTSVQKVLDKIKDWQE